LNEKAIRLKFGTEMENGPRLPREYETTFKCAWPWSSDLIYKFLDPLNHFWQKWTIRLKFGSQTKDGTACIGNMIRP